MAYLIKTFCFSASSFSITRPGHLTPDLGLVMENESELEREYEDEKDGEAEREIRCFLIDRQTTDQT